MTTRREILVVTDAKSLNKAFAKALDIVEAEGLTNPSIGFVPDDHCECPDHNEDDNGFMIRVTGCRWEDVDDDDGE